jgi:hypothetical protein
MYLRPHLDQPVQEHVPSRHHHPLAVSSGLRMASTPVQRTCFSHPPYERFRSQSPVSLQSILKPAVARPQGLCQGQPPWPAEVQDPNRITIKDVFLSLWKDYHWDACAYKLLDPGWFFSEECDYDLRKCRLEISTEHDSKLVLERDDTSKTIYDSAESWAKGEVPILMASRFRRAI